MKRLHKKQPVAVGHDLTEIKRRISLKDSFCFYL
jgi:hypothetical protein